ncbi:MAG TPA: DUF4936 family protein [Casimicrobiaceae bacterium]
MRPLVHCYCYYRVAPAHAEAARKAVRAVFRSVEERLGVIGRLLQRETDALLWMEVYENVRDPERLELALAELLAAHRFFACLAPGSERRMERFVAAA